MPRPAPGRSSRPSALVRSSPPAAAACGSPAVSPPATDGRRRPHSPAASRGLHCRPPEPEAASPSRPPATGSRLPPHRGPGRRRARASREAAPRADRPRRGPGEGRGSKRSSRPRTRPRRSRSPRRRSQALGLLPPAPRSATSTSTSSAPQVAGYYDPKAKTISVVARIGRSGPSRRSPSPTSSPTRSRTSVRPGGDHGDTVGQGDRSLAQLALVEGDATLLMSQWMLHLAAGRDRRAPQGGPGGAGAARTACRRSCATRCSSRTRRA